MPFAFLGYKDSAITGELREELDSADTRAYVGVIRSFEYSLIVTQTCDLQQEDKVRSAPFINVVQVYDAAPFYEADEQALIAKCRYKYLVPLNGSGLDHDGTLWVADLRVDVSVDRSVLLGREPLKAISDDLYVQRCRMLAGYRARPALSDDLIKDHLVPLGSFIRSQAWRKKIKEGWVRCAPTPLDVSVAHVSLVTDSDELINTIEDAVSDWHLEHVKKSTSLIRLRSPKVVAAKGFKPSESEIEIEEYRKGGGRSGP